MYNSKIYIVMIASKKISLLTLIGIIIPFGNIWGPYLVRKLPKNSYISKFRFRLVIFEILLTVASFLTSVMINVKAVNSGFDVQLIKDSMIILLIHNLVIIVTAITLAIVMKRLETENSNKQKQNDAC